MSDQINNPDWAPKTLYKRGQKSRSNTPKAKPKRETDADIDPDTPKKKAKISKDLRDAIVRGRIAAKLKQKDLARLCNVPITTVQSYENGKARPNIGVVRKMERALRCKFPVYK